LHFGSPQSIVEHVAPLVLELDELVDEVAVDDPPIPLDVVLVIPMLVVLVLVPVPVPVAFAVLSVLPVPPAPAGRSYV